MCRSKTHKIGGKKGETQQIDVGLSSMVLGVRICVDLGAKSKAEAERVWLI